MVISIFFIVEGENVTISGGEICWGLLNPEVWGQVSVERGYKTLTAESYTIYQKKKKKKDCFVPYRSRFTAQNCPVLALLLWPAVNLWFLLGPSLQVEVVSLEGLKILKASDESLSMYRRCCHLLDWVDGGHFQRRPSSRQF